MATLEEQVTLAEKYNAESRYREAEDVAHMAIADVHMEQNREWHVRALLALANSLRRRGDTVKAMPFNEEALRLIAAHSIHTCEPAALNMAGLMHLDGSSHIQALEYFTKTIAAAKEQADPFMESQALGNTGNVYRAIGDFARALDFFEQALALDKANGNDKSETQWISAIGIVYQNLGEFSKALEYFSRALSLSQKHGLKERLATVYGNMGIAYTNLRNIEKGLEYMTKALELDEEIGNKAGVARHSGNIGSLYNDLENYVGAMECFKRALAIDEELGNKDNVAVWIGQLGSLYAIPDFEEYDAEKAERFLFQALELSKTVNYKQLTLTLHQTLAGLFEEQERWKEHSEHYKAYHKLEKEVQNEQVASKTQMLENRRKVEEAERDRQVKLARFQEQEKILYNILPAQIAERILDGEKQIADHCENVSVFFSDIVGFTKLSQHKTPAELVGMLNELFTEFDRIARKHGLEKIKTIGDAYMAVAGVPLPQPDHAERAARFALELMQWMIEYRMRSGNDLQIRAGLHCGHAVAGVIGESKFAYDLWGDTVNTASRMESHGLENKIQVTEEFKNELKGKFELEERGEVEVKGKGKMKTYFLH